MADCIYPYEVGTIYSKEASFDLPLEVGYYSNHVKLQRFQQNPTAEEFNTLQISFVQKLSSDGLSGGCVNLEQLLKVSEKFGTTKVSISGDGRDYQLSEFASDHSSEVIIQVELNNKAHVMAAYRTWQQTKVEESVTKKRKTL